MWKRDVSESGDDVSDSGSSSTAKEAKAKLALAKFHDDLRKDLNERVERFTSNRTELCKKAFAVMNASGDGRLREQECVDALMPNTPRWFVLHIALGLKDSEDAQRQQYFDLMHSALMRAEAPDLTLYFGLMNKTAEHFDDERCAEALCATLNVREARAAREEEKASNNAKMEEFLKGSFARHDVSKSGVLEPVESEVFFEHFVQLRAFSCESRRERAWLIGSSVGGSRGLP